MASRDCQSKISSTFDRQTAARFLAALHPAGSVVELRCPGYPKGKATTSGYFDDPARLLDEAARRSGKAPACYVSVNPVATALLARANNRVVEWAESATADADILRRVNCFIDTDAVRPSSVPATDLEHAAALHLADAIRDYLSGLGWPGPLSIDSGNGGALFYAIDLAANDGARDLLRRCLLALAAKFDTEAAHVDVAVFNASRVCRLAGTLNRKGDGTPDRPHRLARLLSVPERRSVVPADLLEALARMAPPPESPRSSHGTANGFTAEDFLQKHGLAVSRVKPWQGGTLYELETCPFNEGHQQTARVIQHPSSALSFQCFHASCKGRDWHALRDLVEPGWREARKGHEKDGGRNRPRSPPYIVGDGDDSGADGPPERWKIVRCSELRKRPDEERWILHGCFARGAITQLNALFKCGKSTFLAHLFRALEAGGTFCGMDCKKAKILCVTEECEDEWAERRDDLGLADNIHFIRQPFLGKPSKKEWLAFLDYLLDKVRTEGYDLLVLDTISDLWHVKDENNTCEVQEALKPLRAFPDTTAIGIVHHIRKSDGNEGTGGRGASSFQGFVDIILEIRRYNASDKKDTRRTLTGYGRPKSVPQELVLRLDEQGYHVEGDKPSVQAKDLLSVLEKIIPAAAPGISRNELQAEITKQKGTGVRHDVLTAALEQGIKDGRWQKAGKKPVRYHRPKVSHRANEESQESEESPPLRAYVAPDADPDPLQTRFDSNGETPCVAEKPIPPPIKTFGGKSNRKSFLARWILSHAQPHRCYVEPFLGGGSVLLAKTISGEEVVGDLDPLRANLWAVLRSPDQFPVFLESVRQIPFERASWEQAREQLQHNSHLDAVSRATAYFTLSRLSRQGECRDFLTPSTRQRRGMDEHRSAWLSAIESLPLIHERLRRVTVLPPTPAVEVIRRYAEDAGVLIYADPPYVHATRVTRDNYGEYEMSEADHRELLSVLRQCRGQVLLSGYDSALYREMLADWQRHIRPMPADSGGGKSKSSRLECLWSNQPAAKPAAAAPAYLAPDADPGALETPFDANGETPC